MEHYILLRMAFKAQIPSNSCISSKYIAYLLYMRVYVNLKANMALGLVFAFLVNTLGPVSLAQAQAGADFRLPEPGIMVHLSPKFNPPILKGI